jgi:energy-converting hydrogenase Eha subunit A
MTSWWNLFPLTMILIATLALLIYDDWRRDIVAMAVLYLGIFILIVQVMPLTLAAVKLITGWMTTLILALSLPKKELIRQTGMTANRIFRAFSFGLICVIAFLVSKTIGTALQIKPEIAFAAIAVFGGGLLNLGMKISSIFHHLWDFNCFLPGSKYFTPVSKPRY